MILTIIATYKCFILHVTIRAPTSNGNNIFSEEGSIPRNRKISIAALMLLSVFALAAISGVLPSGIPPPIDLANVEASNHESHTHTQQSISNQQAISSAIAAHGADAWHEAGFKGEGVKIGIIDFGFEGLQAALETTEAPASVQAACFQTLADQIPTHDLSVCEAAASTMRC